MTIKAIETKYKGYKFRSRLEARWAIFFDALGLDWEYEPEGYVLENGTCYLPDFWLPFDNPRFENSGYWFEVKGPEPTDKEMAKATALAIQSKRHTFIAQGVPGKHPLWIAYSDKRSGGYEECHWDELPSPTDVICWMGEQAIITETVAYAHTTSLLARQAYSLWISVSRWSVSVPDVVKAITAARSARFEHGETP